MPSVAAKPVRRKLIEVALPLDAINAAAAREKSIRHGHPSTLHLWWARRPLAAARAVIFAQMVDDPAEYVDVLLSDPAEKRAAARALKGREAARELRYRLYAACERRKRAAEALAYNGLVQSWPEISRLAAAGSAEQGGLFGDAHGDVEQEA